MARGAVFSFVVLISIVFLHNTAPHTTSHFATAELVDTASTKPPTNRVRLHTGKPDMFLFTDPELGITIPVWYHLPAAFDALAPELDELYNEDQPTGSTNTNTNTNTNSDTNDDDEEAATHQRMLLEVRISAQHLARLGSDVDADMAADVEEEDVPIEEERDDANIRRQQLEHERQNIAEMMDRLARGGSAMRAVEINTNATANSSLRGNTTNTTAQAANPANSTTAHPGRNNTRTHAAQKQQEDGEAGEHDNQAEFIRRLARRSMQLEDSNSQILFVMHGCLRNGASYVNAWAPLAERYNFLVICPQFSQADFPEYNTGNMYNSTTGQAHPRKHWLFGTIERIFDTINKSGVRRAKYHIFGHSAGAQFVHRLVLFADSPRVESAVSANAGWYTLPSFDEAYPYGLHASGLSREQLAGALTRRLTLLLGQEDNKEKYLRQTRRAMAQGVTRFDRGITCFLKARDMASSMGVQLQWNVKTVPGSGHWHKGMAVVAVREFGFAPTNPVVGVNGTQCNALVSRNATHPRFLFEDVPQ